jgi:putative ABC transport system permease protein
MIKNLILVALRNFRRDRWYSLLNILGLTIGITFGLFLIFYIKDELNYDRYNVNSERIYRISANIKEPEKETMNWASTQYPLASVLQKEFPEVEEAVRFVNRGTTMFRNGDLRFYEEKVFCTDSNVFKVFTYPFIEGDARTALVAPYSIVLTQSTAEKYFGKNTAVIGRSLQNDKGEVFKITGVVKNVPKNSHLLFNLLISTSTLPRDFSDSWGAFSFFTYVLLKPNVDAAAFEKKLLPMYDKHMASIFAASNIRIKYVVQPITAIHLHSQMGGEPEELGSMSYIYIFSAVALFMLVIACINYMNLTTARSARRAKEIGVRKVTGSTRPMLIAQFLVESLLTSLAALLVSLGLIALFLPLFNSISGKAISLESLFELNTILILVAVVVFVGLAGGSYPAFYLSKFNPIQILKGNLSKGASNVTLRRVLVVVQFSISMIMLICTWVVYNQLNYLRKVDLGFDKEQVLSLRANTGRDIRGDVRAFTEAIRKNPQVLSISTAESPPGGRSIGFSLFSIESKKGYVDKGVDCYGVDPNYFKTMGMRIVKGRAFSANPADTLKSIIVNENMVKYFGWDEPIGKRVKIPGDTTGFYFEVVGVVKDFNQRALYNAITPLILFDQLNNKGIQVKLASTNIPATIADIEHSWKTYFPDLPFSYVFLDQSFDSQYAADQRRGKIFTAFSVLTILITCLGLLGLIAFTTEQRQKEISIRKIMGASLMEIIPLLTRNFIFLVGMSCLVAFPVAFLFMSNWLKIFPYNTGLTVMPFLLSALAVLAITLLTVIFHAVRAAVASPAKSLRAE